ncbi:hypothetical protein OAA27_02315, partial [bacterium]|nr:hypothetical protein [bacterium]
RPATRTIIPNKRKQRRNARPVRVVKKAPKKLRAERAVDAPLAARSQPENAAPINDAKLDVKTAC